jgi:beta-galactosidase
MNSTANRRLVLAIAFFAIVSTRAERAESSRLHESFDESWQFHLGDIPGAQDPAMATSAWRRLNLPHDWSVEGEFSPTNASCTGFLPGGIGWYRKTFSPDPSWLGRKVLVTFDGVYRGAEVWINGHSLGVRPYGYTTFQLDLTAFLLTNAPNVLAVRVDRTNVADSRWYPGSGIYRHVWLTVTSPVRVPLWGDFITTPRANADFADVVVRTEVTNETAEAQSVRVAWEIEQPDGNRMAKSQSRKSSPRAEATPSHSGRNSRSQSFGRPTRQSFTR